MKTSGSSKELVLLFFFEDYFEVIKMAPRYDTQENVVQKLWHAKN